MSPTPIAIAIVEHNGQFLIGRRPPGAVLAGLWEFPGGKIEDGETPAECAARECLEEAGVAIEVVELQSECIYKYDHGPVHLSFLHCRPLVPSQPPRPPFRWVKREDLGRYDFPPANTDVVKALAGDSRPSLPRAP